MYVINANYRHTDTGRGTMKLSISPRQAVLLATIQAIIVVRLGMSAYSHIVFVHSLHPIAAGITSLFHITVPPNLVTVVGSTVAGLELLLAGILCYGMAVLVRRTPPYITRKGLLMTIAGLASTVLLSSTTFLVHGWNSSPEAIFSIALVPFMLASIILAAIERASLPTEPRFLANLLANYK